MHSFHLQHVDSHKPAEVQKQKKASLGKNETRIRSYEGKEPKKEKHPVIHSSFHDLSLSEIPSQWLVVLSSFKNKDSKKN